MTAAGRWSDHRCLGAPDAGLDIGGVDFGGSQTRRLHRNQKERTRYLPQCVTVRAGRQQACWLDLFRASRRIRWPRRFRSGRRRVGARGLWRQWKPVSRPHFLRNRACLAPAHAEYLQTPTIIKVAPLAPANFGHFLGNALYPAFVTAWRLFGARAASTPLQVLFAGVNQTDIRAMARRCERWRAEGGARAGDGATRCARHTELVAKFVSQLLPAVSAAEPPLWEGELPRLAAQRSSKLLCAEALVVGTGDLGFSTKYRLDGGAGRHPPQLLWSDFVEHASARLLAPRLPPSSRRPPLGAALVMKLGAAPSAGAPLRASIEATRPRGQPRRAAQAERASAA